ncbi:hypothetical protein K7X08_032634 [Anisodus acutangulus]|uniref:Uncharacterized protein n=1 Tax=Anisodus acutangulus TaxID=402998 RepID=A0A9Q1LZW4_9SOLA|nr:hypothetical protein K7X08_032634 [Anisodus acutangulus]
MSKMLNGQIEWDSEIMSHLTVALTISENFESVADYIDQAGSRAKTWKLLDVVASAERRFEDAEAIVNLALNETGQVYEMEHLRLKVVL